MKIRKDWAFTDEGDLELGPPKVDSDGNRLYVHPDGTVNKEQDENGLLIRDVGIEWNREAEKTLILNRLKTDAPDWFHHPMMGGSLSDLIGDPNSRQTGEKGIRYILNALLYKDSFHESEIDVRAIPVGHTEIMFVITIDRLNERLYRLPLIFHLESGLLMEYQTENEGGEE